MIFKLPEKKSKVIERELGCDTIYVGNLGSDVTKQQLRLKFSNCGGIENIKIKMNKKKENLFGFITFTDNSFITGALLLNGTLFNGKKIVVKLKHQ